MSYIIFWPRHSGRHQGEDVSSVSPGFLGNSGSSAAQALMLGGPRGPTLATFPSSLPCIHPSAFWSVPISCSTLNHCCPWAHGQIHMLVSPSEILISESQSSILKAVDLPCATETKSNQYFPEKNFPCKHNMFRNRIVDAHSSEAICHVLQSLLAAIKTGKPVSNWDAILNSVLVYCRC